MWANQLKQLAWDKYRWIFSRPFVFWSEINFSPDCDCCDLCCPSGWTTGIAGGCTSGPASCSSWLWWRWLSSKEGASAWGLRSKLRGTLAWMSPREWTQQPSWRGAPSRGWKASGSLATLSRFQGLRPRRSNPASPRISALEAGT